MSAADAIPVVLIVDDDPEDALMLEAAARHGGHQVDLVHIGGGGDLLAALAAGRLPERTLLLLDLDMPELHGSAVLERLRRDPLGRLLPVVVYTTTTDQRQVDRAYSLGANAVITKPSALPALATLIGALLTIWFSQGNLPRRALLDRSP